MFGASSERTLRNKRHCATEASERAPACDFVCFVIPGPTLRNAFRVTVGALDRMDIVMAFGVFERRVHGLDVDAAVGELWMTGGARGASGLSVLLVAGKAAETFVDADWGAIVAGSDLRISVGSMALIAECLARIGADFDEARTIMHLRKRQTGKGDVVLLAAIEER